MFLHYKNRFLLRNTNLQNSKRHGTMADCNKKFEVLLKAHGWGGRRGSGGGTSRTWRKSIQDWMQALRVWCPSEKGGLQSWKSTSTEPLVVTWNFIDVLSSKGVQYCFPIWRKGVVREGAVEKGVVAVLKEISMPSFSSASEGGLQQWCWRVWGERHRVAKTHRIPYLYRSFSAKEPYISWLFCGKWSAT